jgi:hypothetical protein
MSDMPSIPTMLKQIRCLTQDARERISLLRPAWGVHLADDTLCRIAETIDTLEVALAPTERDEPEDATSAVMAGRSTTRGTP